MRTGRWWSAVLLGAAAALAGCGKGEEPREEEVAPHVGDPIAEADAFIAKKGIDRSFTDWRLRVPRPPRLGFPTDRHVHWVLDTNKGRIVAKLWHEVAPLHVSAFVVLTRLGFYDGLLMHRVVQGFVAQGGCPLSVLAPARAGQGALGWGLPLELRPDVKHDRAGLLSTARTDAPNSDANQFFITFGPTPLLDPVPGNPDRRGYTLFGEVVEGMDAVRAMEAVGAPPGVPMHMQKPRERIVITKATVELR